VGCDAFGGDVRAVLNQIIDPCSRVAGAPVGLVDMGLIRRLTVTPASAPWTYTW